MRDLGSKVATAVRWFAIIKFISQAISWVITFYILTILSKADYGLFAMTTVVIAFLSLVSEIGLSAVLLQKKDLSIYHKKQIFGVIILVGFALTTIVSSTAPFVATFYQDERLTSLIITLGLQFLLTPFYIIPRATLERELDFKRRSIIELITSAAASFTTLICASYGYGVWALIYGHLATICCRLIGYNLVNPFKHLPTFNFKGVKSMLSFGGYTMGSRWLWFFSSNADILIAGKLLDIETIGLFKFAKQISSIPAQKISPIINQVAFPAFAKIQDSKELVAAHYLKAIGLLGLISFPILWGLASIGNFIPNYLGEHWQGAITTLQILCFALPFRMINGLTPSITSALGHPEKDFINQIWLFVGMSSLYFTGCYFGGLFGLALSWALGFPIIIARNLYATLPLIGLSLSDVLKKIAIPLILASVMLLVVFAIQALLNDLDKHLLFAISIISGIGSYSILTLIFNKEMAKTLIRFVKK
mgnify:CR=1 FL=1